MRFLSLIFFTTVFSASANAEQQDCNMLGDKLYECQKFECYTTSDAFPDGKIKNTVAGYNTDEDCVHEQTNPNGDKVLCRYSEESRKFIALKLKKAGSDLLGLEEQSPFDENIMADIFHNECDVISKNPDDKPVVDENIKSSLDDVEQNESEESGFNAEQHNDKSNADDNTSELIEDNGNLADGL